MSTYIEEDCNRLTLYQSFDNLHKKIKNPLHQNIDPDNEINDIGKENEPKLVKT